MNSMLARLMTRAHGNNAVHLPGRADKRARCITSKWVLHHVRPAVMCGIVILHRGKLW
jgi:hypothetical protein